MFGNLTTHSRSDFYLSEINDLMQMDWILVFGLLKRLDGNTIMKLINRKSTYESLFKIPFILFHITFQFRDLTALLEITVNHL